MTFSALWAFLAVGLPVLAALIANLSSVDLAYHLRAGGDILDGHGIPATDTFTFTAAGQPWFDQQWAAQVILAGTYRLAGWGGLAILRAVLVGVVFGCTFAACHIEGLSRRTAAIVTLGAFVVAAPTLALRPQLLGMALFALGLLVITLRRRRPWIVFLIVPLTLVWANVHGSFFLGPLLAALAWLQDLHERSPRARTTLAAAILAALATIVTPFGPAVWAYAAGLSTNPSVTERIVEWQPTSIRTIPGLLFFASALLVALVLATRGRRIPWSTLVWLATFFVIGVWAIRGIAWWPLAAAVALAGVLAYGHDRWSAEPVERPRRPNVLIAGAVVVAGFALLPMWRPTDAGLQAPVGVVAAAPSALTARLREIARPGDRLYNPQEYGSWFEFALPDAPVAVDSRIEVIPEAVWDDYDAVSSGRADWSAILDRWGVTLVLASSSRGQALLDRLSHDPDWRPAATDELGTLFVRADRPSG
jgi:hypothetical protein